MSKAGDASIPTEPDPLALAIAEMKAEARKARLSDADVDAELAAHKAERRDRSPGN